MSDEVTLEERKVIYRARRGLKEIDVYFDPYVKQHYLQAEASERALFKELVDQEDPNSPISDDLIVSTLAKDGVSVARRTVAKYRKMESIPSSFARKRRNVLSGVV